MPLRSVRREYLAGSMQIAIVGLVTFCTNVVQPSEQGFELVEILKSLNDRTAQLRFRFWPASGIFLSGVVRRSIFDVCTGGCIVEKLVIRLSGILGYNRRSLCHTGRPKFPTE